MFACISVPDRPTSPLLIAPLAMAVPLGYAALMFVGAERPLARLRRRLHRAPAAEPMLAGVA